MQEELPDTISCAEELHLVLQLVNYLTSQVVWHLFLSYLIEVVVVLQAGDGGIGIIFLNTSSSACKGRSLNLER